jgi:hypothetical protein
MFRPLLVLFVLLGVSAQAHAYSMFEGVVVHRDNTKLVLKRGWCDFVTLCPPQEVLDGKILFVAPEFTPLRYKEVRVGDKVTIFTIRDPAKDRLMIQGLRMVKPVGPQGVSD